MERKKVWLIVNMEKKALTDANYIFAIILVLLVLLNSLFPKGLIGSQGF